MQVFLTAADAPENNQEHWRRCACLVDLKLITEEECLSLESAYR